MTIFDQKYRVVAVDDDRITIRGVQSGEVLVIHADPSSPITNEDYPLGKLIALADPSAAALDQDC